MLLAGSSMAALAQQRYFFTGPYGAGGTWNLYEVVVTGAGASPGAPGVANNFAGRNQDAAHADAQAKTSGGTGLTVTNGALAGHLVAISNRDENSFVCAAASASPGGTSNVWIGLTDAGSETGGYNAADPGLNRGGNPTATGGKWYWRGTGAGAGSEDVLEATQFAAWAGAEPNNASSAEHAAEMRTDGLWNDNNGATQNRRYVIEWDTQELAPVAGAKQLPLYLTYPSGAAGKYNLYYVGLTPCRADSTPLDVHTKYFNFAVAKEEAENWAAGATGVSGLTGVTTKGHLMAITSTAENSLALRLHLYGGNTSTAVGLAANFMLGCSDSPTYGGTESGFSPTSGWVWTGTAEPFAFQQFLNRPFAATATQPDNGGGVESAVELLGTGTWNDYNGGLSYNSASAATAYWRRAIMEWEIQSDTPIAGAGKLAPILSGTRTFTNAETTSLWTVREFRNSVNANHIGIAGLWVADHAEDPLKAPPANTSAILEGTREVLNLNDQNGAISGGGVNQLRDNGNGRGGSGVFYPDLPYIGDIANAQTANGDDNIVFDGRVKVTLTANLPYTFNVHSDDGFVLKLSHPTNGVRITSTGGTGGVDPGDAGPNSASIFFPVGTGDSNCRGTFVVDATGDYTLEYVGFEGSGGSYIEVSMAQGTYQWDWEAKWTLVGGVQPQSAGTTGTIGYSADGRDYNFLPFNTPLFPQGPAARINAPAPTDGFWQWNFVQSVAIAAGSSPTPLSEGCINPGFPFALNALAAGGAATVDQTNFINATDSSNIGRRGYFQPDDQIPGSNFGADDNNYVTAARTLWTVPAAGLYTVMIRADDVAAMRIRGASWNGRVTGFNGYVDTYDASTIWHHLGSGDCNIRAVVNIPAAGPYELEFVQYENTGGSNMEVFYAPGVNFLEQDTTWSLIGNPSGLTPLLPAVINNSTASNGSTWGLHMAKDPNTQMISVASVIATLEDTGGFAVHSRAQTPVLNLFEPDFGGPAGYFGGNIPVPGEESGINDDDFAVHARSRIQISQADVYTFAVRFSDLTLMRIKAVGTGAWLQWKAVSNDFSFDLADRTVVGWPNANTGTALNQLGRCQISLTPGFYDIEVLSAERNNDFHVEMYAVRGDQLGIVRAPAGGPEFINQTAPLAIPYVQQGQAWRLVGHVSSGSYAQPGMDSAGWSALVTPGLNSTTRPAGLGTGLAGYEAWLDGGAASNGYSQNGKTTDTKVNMAVINWNDPGFGGPGSVPNDEFFFLNNAGLNTNASNIEDNFQCARFTGNLVIPVDGSYELGWQGDDGGYFELVNPTSIYPGFTGFTRLTAEGVNQAIITNSSETSPGAGDGTPNARIEMGGGGGNTRTMGEIFLKAGTYPVRVFWFEGTGGSYFEILASPFPAQAGLVSLLARNGANAAVADQSGLAIVSQTSVITDVTMNASRQVSLSFTTVPGSTYTVQTSLSLGQTDAWSAAPGTSTVVATGTSLTYVSPSLPAGDPKRFWRVIHD